MPVALNHTNDSRWRISLVALSFLWLWTVFVFRSTGSSMVEIWARSDTFMHGFLVPPLVLWLLWRKRDVLVTLAPQPAPKVAFIWVLVLCIWFLANMSSVNSISQLAFVTLLVLSVPAILGGVVSKQIIFPLCFAFFSVPLGEFLLPQLMEWTANFTVLALRLSGIPVYREGLQFIIPTGSWSVIEACSGVRYLIASFTVGTLFAYLNYRSTQRRVVFMVVSLTVPVFANWVRAYLIVLLGHFSGNTLAVGVDHLIYGWLFFGLVIIAMFAIGTRWSEQEGAQQAPTLTIPNESPTRPGPRLVAITLCFALLAILAQWATWAFDHRADQPRSDLVAPLVLGSGWEAVGSDELNFKPAFLNAGSEMNQHYAKGGRRVGLYVGHYHHQNFNKKMVNSSNVLVRSKDPLWREVATGTRLLDVEGHTQSVVSAELRASLSAAVKADRRLLAWRYFWINGTWTSSDISAKFLEVYHRLLGHGDDAAVVVIYTENEPGQNAAMLLQSFLSNNNGAINSLLSNTKKTNDQRIF
jgi:exosortase A